MTSAGDGPVTSKVLIIDISNFEERKKEIADQILHAARDVGFFYIKGHGIDWSEVERVFKAGEKFLALPEEAKQKYVWIPDRYLGWRSQTDLESVTGNLDFQGLLLCNPAAVVASNFQVNQRNHRRH